MTMPVNAATTALMVTDPQNDFLSTKGVFWDDLVRPTLFSLWL